MKNFGLSDRPNHNGYSPLEVDRWMSVKSGSYRSSPALTVGLGDGVLWITFGPTPRMN